MVIWPSLQRNRWEKTDNAHRGCSSNKNGVGTLPKN